MAHQYRQRILVTLRANGEPGGLFWRGTAYSVDEVLARWHLRDRWWATRDGQADAAEGHHRGTEVPASGPGELKSADISQRLNGDPPEPVSHESPRVSPDFSPSAPYAGTSVPRRNDTARAVSSDRYYYRLRCVEGLLCEVYWDAVCDAWTLDRVLD